MIDGTCQTYTEQHNVPVFFAVVEALDTLPVIPPATPKVVGRQIFCVAPFDADKTFATAEDFAAALSETSLEVLFDNYYENPPQIIQAISQVVLTQTVGGVTSEYHFTVTSTTSEYITNEIDNQTWYTGVRLLCQFAVPKEVEIPFPYTPDITSGTDLRHFNLLSGMLNITVSGLGVPPLIYDRYSLTITDTTGTPEPITNVRPAGITDLRFTIGEFGKQIYLRVDWDPVPKSSFYKVDLALDTNQTATPTPWGGGDNPPVWTPLAWDGAPAEQKPTDPHAVFVPVTLHSYYYVRACAVNAAKDSTELPGAWYAERVLIELTATGEKPAAPTNLEAESIPYLTINLNWTESVSTNVVKYNVYRSTSYSGTYTKIGSVPDPLTMFTDHPRPNNGVDHTPVMCYYYVTAVSDAGIESDPSNIVGAVPIAMDDFSIEAETLEMAIKNVNGDKITNGTITGPKIHAASVDLNQVACGTLMGSKVVAGTVEAYTGVFANRLKACPISFSVNSGIAIDFCDYGTDPGQTPCPADHDEEDCWITVRRISQETTGGCNCRNGCWEDFVCEVPQSWIDESVAGQPTGSGTFTMSPNTERYAYLRLLPAGALAEPDGVDGVLRFRTEYPTGLYDIPLVWVHCDAAGAYTMEDVYINGTVIDGAHIATGTVQAEHIAAKTITADKIQARELLAYEGIFPSRLKPNTEANTLALTKVYAGAFPHVSVDGVEPYANIDVASLTAAVPAGGKISIWALGNGSLAEGVVKPALNVTGTMEEIQYEVTSANFTVAGETPDIDADGNWFVYVEVPKDTITHEPVAGPALTLHIGQSLPIVTRDGTTLPVVLATIVRGEETVYVHNTGTGSDDEQTVTSIQTMTNFVNGTYISGDYIKTPIITADSAFVSSISANALRTGRIAGLKNPYTYFDLDHARLHLALVENTTHGEDALGSLFDWNGMLGELTLQAKSMSVQDAEVTNNIADFAGIVLKSNQTLDKVVATDWVPEHHYKFGDKVRYLGSYYECTNATGAFSTEQNADPPSWWPPDTTTQCWTVIADTGADGTITGLGFFDYSGEIAPKAINDRALSIEEPGLQGMMYGKDDELHLRAMHGLFLGGGDNAGAEDNVQIWGHQLLIRTGLNPIIETTSTSSPGIIFNDRTGNRLAGLYVETTSKDLFYMATDANTKQRVTVSNCINLSASAYASRWSGNMVTLSWDDANRYYLILTQNTVINLEQPGSGQPATFMIHIRQDETGGHTVTWKVDGLEPDDESFPFKKLLWPDGTPPEISTAAWDMNVVSLSYTPGNYYVGTYSLGLK